MTIIETVRRAGTSLAAIAAPAVWLLKAEVLGQNDAAAD